MDKLQNADGGGTCGGGRLIGNPLEGLGNTEVQQFLDSFQSTLTSKGFNEQTVGKIMQAMEVASQVLAKYNIMGLGLGLGMAAMATLRTDSTPQQIATSQASTGSLSMDPHNPPSQQLTQNNGPFRTVDHTSDRGRRGSEKSSSMIGQTRWDSRGQRLSLGGGGAGGPPEGAPGGGQSNDGTERSIEQRKMKLYTLGYLRKQELNAAEMNIPLQAAQLLGEFDAAMNEEEQLAADLESGEALNPQESQANGKAMDTESAELMAVEENETGVGGKFHLVEYTFPAGNKPFAEFSVAVEPEETKKRPVQKTPAIQNSTDHPEFRTSTDKNTADKPEKTGEEVRRTAAAPRSIKKKNNQAKKKRGKSLTAPTEKQILRGIILFPGKAVAANYLVLYGPTVTFRKNGYFNTIQAESCIERLCNEGFLTLVDINHLSGMPKLPAKAYHNFYRKLPLDSEKLKQVLEKYSVSREEYTRVYHASSCKALKCLNEFL